MQRVAFFTYNLISLHVFLGISEDTATERYNSCDVLCRLWQNQVIPFPKILRNRLLSLFYLPTSHLQDVWKYLKKSHSTILRAERATIVLYFCVKKQSKVKLDIFGVFLNTVPMGDIIGTSCFWSICSVMGTHLLIKLPCTFHGVCMKNLFV